MMPRAGFALERPTSSSTDFLRLLAVLTFISTLSGCGGSPSSNAPSPSPAPAPAPQPIPAQLTVPDPVGYDANHLAAFNRLNELRLAAGLGMLAQSAQIDLAAQSHADWEAENDTFSHIEVTGSPGFTGVGLTDRMLHEGYTPAGGAEVNTTGYGIDSAVDALFNGVYHRALLMMPTPLDVGIGLSNVVEDKVELPLVIDFAWPDDFSDRSGGQLMQQGTEGVTIWPADGSTGAWTRMGAEEPNPVPSIEVSQLGTPVSVSADLGTVIQVGSFGLSRSDDQQQVPVVLLTSATDSNQLLPSSFVALVPTEPLLPNSTYAVSFSGSISMSNGPSKKDYSKNWTFQTGNR